MIRFGLIGATGLVGLQCLEVLEESPEIANRIGTLRLFASERSAGAEVTYQGKTIIVEELEQVSFDELDIAIFAVGNDLSRMYIPKALEAGTYVVDNSSAYRLDADVPLVVPEVNGGLLESMPQLVANPNCSTAQLVLALEPLHRAVGIKRVVVSTYQSASGAGTAGEEALREETIEVLQGSAGSHATSIDKDKNKNMKGLQCEDWFHKRRLAFNVVPQIDAFLENGYTREEMKLVLETQKILGKPDFDISATAVRVPVFRGHSEAVTVDLAEELSRARVLELLNSCQSLEVSQEDPEYPTALESAGNNRTWVGRIRQDVTRPKTVHFWVVSDNLRKGAATNALQIADILMQGIVGKA